MTWTKSWNGGYGTRNGGTTRTTSPAAMATRVSRQSFMGRDAVTSQYNRAPRVPARDSTCAGLFLFLSRSLCYGYKQHPLNAKIFPFNPATCHTTNNFNILITIRSPPPRPFLYFDKAHYSGIEGTESLRRSPNNMHKPIKYAEKALVYAAGAAWFVFDKFNQIGQNPSFVPKWSDKPLLKSWEKTKPPLGWPRETDSLCPRCVPEIRQQILDGKTPLEVLYTDKPGEIKAQVIERDGKILMVKDCPIHGHFEDVMAIDPAFFKHLEAVFPGRDIRAHNDAALHHHGSSTVIHGRGSVLTVDLTNRCNMMLSLIH